MSAFQFLLLEANLTDAEVVQATLREGGIDCELLRVETRADFIRTLETDEINLILADYALSSFDEIAALTIACRLRPDTPFIFISGSLGEELAIEAIKQGATDYVLKQRLGRLVPSVQRALQEVPELDKDTIDRKQALSAIESDLKDTQLLHELSARLVTEGDIQTLYQEIIAAAIALTRADAGTVQILDEATQELLLLATQGFERNMTEYFYRVSASSNTPCGIALKNGDAPRERLRQRTFVDFDVPESEDPDGSMRMHVDAGYLSAQSTPLIARSGKLIGMVSTHWRKHRRPSDCELRFLDLLARQAADLIEHRQTQVALRESEERLRLATEAANMYAWDFNLRTNIPTFSENVEQVTGHVPTNNFEENLEQIHPDDRAIVRQAFQDAQTNGDRFDYEMRSFTQDSQLQWFRVTGSLIRDSQAVPVRAIGICQNITERKQAEQALQKANERFRIAESAANGFVYDWEIQIGIVTRSEGFNQVLGYAPGEIAQTPDGWIDLIHPDDRQVLQVASPAAMREAQNAFALEYRVRHKVGHYINVLDRALILRDASGTVGRIVGSTVDVSDRKRAEAALRESEERFRTLANTAPALIWFNDAQGNNRFINQHFLDFTGKSAEQIRGEGWQELVHPDDVELYIADYFVAVREQRSWHNRNRIRRHDGVWRWHDNYAQPLLGADGIYLGHVGVTIDNTDAIEAEIALRESEAKYRSLFESMDEGYILVDAIFDENDQPIDLLYLEANPAAVKMTGTELVGRRTLEIDPNFESRWFETFGRVAKTGIGERHEFYTAPLDVWYNFYVFKVGEPNQTRVAAVYQDVTDRKQAEATLYRNMNELKRLNRAMVNRELRMIELKKEVNDLCKRQREAERYPLQFEQGGKNDV
ncbi:PAS domain S-box protein [Nostoc sp. ChiQUE01b]|uniref:PAS domain S-box protein n=1 Tax=Nostoc sp. ChiQUE01b TaxID=3075376 RepID=UPI002AD3DD4D|nr:PAS domain S-box protein [Nostoc sp. ChiQUE01b]MDZ8263172.1 PAS domain S-box protein [Nostoc sp. ChiQUE01b]